MYLDAAVFGVPAVLGLLGAWYGLGRFLVTWPMRWLVGVLGASLAALLMALYFAVYGEVTGIDVGTAITTVLAAVAFLLVLAPLLMFMGNLRDRVEVWTRDRRVGSAGRVFGGLVGIVCGLVLVTAPYLLYDALRSDRSDTPDWARESVALPYLNGAAAEARNALASVLRFAGNLPRSLRRW
jgi:uncharacterized membrane protein required for colicin V production